MKCICFPDPQRLSVFPFLKQLANVYHYHTEILQFLRGALQKSAREKCALSSQNETNFSADLQFIYMLAFDFRLIYNPTRLCLMVYLESRRRWGRGRRRGAAWQGLLASNPRLPPPGREAAGPGLSLWFASSSGGSSGSARSNRRVLGPATAWRGDAESEAFLWITYLLPLREQGFGGKEGRWLGTAGLPSLARAYSGSCAAWIQGWIGMDGGEFTEVYCFICLTMYALIQSSSHPSGSPSIL